MADVLQAWTEAKARIWRERDHPRGPDGKFIEKGGGFGTMLDKLAALGMPVFSPSRVNASRGLDAPGLADVDARIDGLEAKDLIDDPDDAKAFVKTLKRKAIALDTAKMVEEYGGMDSTPPVLELNRQKRAALGTLGERLGFTPEETDEASEWLDRALTSWAIGGSLSERRKQMFVAMAHLRAGGKADSPETRGMLLQRAYTDVVWRQVHGDDDVTVVRVLGDFYAERLRAAAEFDDDWELETWPLTSWAEARAEKSLISRWADSNGMILERDVARNEAWLLFNGEGTFRSRGLKAPGELIVDDQTPLTPETIKVRDLAAEGLLPTSKMPERDQLRRSQRLRADFNVVRDRYPDATEGQRWTAYTATASPLTLELLGIDAPEPERDYQGRVIPLRLPYLEGSDGAGGVYQRMRAFDGDVSTREYAELLDTVSGSGKVIELGDPVRAEWHERVDDRYELDRAFRSFRGADLDRSKVTLVPPGGKWPTYYDDGDAETVSLGDFIQRAKAGELDDWTFHGAEATPDPVRLNADKFEVMDRVMAHVREHDVDQDMVEFARRIEDDASTAAIQADAVERGYIPFARQTTRKNLEPGQRYYAPVKDSYYSGRENDTVYVIEEHRDFIAERADAYDRSMTARMLLGNDELMDEAEWIERAHRETIDRMWARETRDGGYGADYVDGRQLVLSYPFKALHPGAADLIETA